MCTFALAFFLLQLPIYDTLGLPLMLSDAGDRPGRPRAPGAGGFRPAPAAQHRLPAASARYVRGLPVLVAGTVAGALVGLSAALLAPPPDHVSRVFMAITPAPVYLDTEVEDDEEEETDRRARQAITVDTEAALLMSEETLRAAARSVDSTPRRPARRPGRHRAARTPASWCCTCAGPDPAEIPGLADAVSGAYLEAREDYLDQRRARPARPAARAAADPAGRRQRDRDGATDEADPGDQRPGERPRARWARSCGRCLRSPADDGTSCSPCRALRSALLGAVILITLTPPRPRRRPRG